MKRGRRLAGPGTLAYRVGTYRTFMARMIGAAGRDPRLAGLNVEARGDFTSGLMGAWARVCDVLTFYQERIANEGYLATAAEPVSVLHLASAVGARRRPAVAGRAHLAFKLLGAAGRKDRLFTDPAQPIMVQNAPGSNQLPVIFECRERTELRAAWNAIPASIGISPQPPRVWPGCRSLLLAGVATGAKPGSGLLICAADHARSWFVLLDTVQIDRTRSCTLVTWRDGIPKSDGSWPRLLQSPTLFTQSAGLFGRTAAAWGDVPDATKEAIGVRQGGILRLETQPPDGTSLFAKAYWRSAASTLPPGELRFVSPGGTRLLAGTSRGMFGSLDGGCTWTAFPLPSGRHDVFSLLRSGDGRLYAGTAAGMVLTSADGGESWSALPNTVLLPSGATFGRDVLAFLHLLRKDPSSLGQWNLTAPIRTLVLAEGGEDGSQCLYIGTDKGVFTMPVNGLYWRPFNGGDFPERSSDSGAADVLVTSMAELDGRLVAVTDRGMFATKLRTPAWERLHPPLPRGATVTCMVHDRKASRLFVGTSAGVFVSSDRARRWAPFTTGFGKHVPPVSSLAVAGDLVAAATPAGIYVSAVGAAGWRLTDEQDLLLFEADPDLFDGSAGPALRERFLRFGIVLGERLETRQLEARLWEIRDLAGGPEARVFRLRTGAGLVVSQVLRNGAGPAALSGSRGQLLASLPLGPPLNSEWPDFTNSGSELILDRQLHGLAEDGVLITAPASAAVIADPVSHHVRKSDAVLHRAFGRQATVTRVVVDCKARLPPCDPRTTSVYAGARAVLFFAGALQDHAPVEGRRLRLSGGGGLTAGRWLQVSGPRAAAAFLQPRVSDAAIGEAQWVARCPADAAPFLDQQMVSGSLRAALANGGIALSLEWAVTVIEAGSVWLLRDRDRTWQIDLGPGDAAERPLRVIAASVWEVVKKPLADGAGEWVFASGDTVQTAAAGTVRIAGEGRGQGPTAGLTIVWQPARSSQKPVTEVVEVAEVDADAASGIFTLDLAASLEALYDPAACRVCANVALATQGQTITHEVLGSGSRTKVSQRFRLHQGPLTYLRGHAARAEPVLEVEVDSRAKRALQLGSTAAPAPPSGARWSEVPSLAHAGPADRVYALSTDETGATILTFGDGLQGSRLPSGSENVTASYRAGAGACGNVPAGSLIALRKHQPGICSVTNPVAGHGGADAESIESLRARAPRRLRHYDRIVTADDYHAAAMEAAGIRAALVDLVERHGSSPIVCVTVTTEASAPDEAGRVREALQASMEVRRAAQLELRILPPRRAIFNVRLAIGLLPGADRAETEEAVFSALFQAFGGGRDAIGATVEPHAILEVASRVPNVAAASLLALHRGEEPPRGTAGLPAARAALNTAGGGLEAAELLVIGRVGIVVRP